MCILTNFKHSSSVKTSSSAICQKNALKKFLCLSNSYDELEPGMAEC